MAPRIDSDLLAAIRFEFEYGYKPDVVLEHLREISMPVVKSHFWAMFKNWHEYSQLYKTKDLSMFIKKLKILCFYMLQANCSNYKHFTDFYSNF